MAAAISSGVRLRMKTGLPRHLTVSDWPVLDRRDVDLDGGERQRRRVRVHLVDDRPGHQGRARPRRPRRSRCRGNRGGVGSAMIDGISVAKVTPLSRTAVPRSWPGKNFPPVADCLAAGLSLVQSCGRNAHIVAGRAAASQPSARSRIAFVVLAAVENPRISWPLSADDCTRSPRCGRMEGCAVPAVRSFAPSALLREFQQANCNVLRSLRRRRAPLCGLSAAMNVVNVPQDRLRARGRYDEPHEPWRRSRLPRVFGSRDEAPEIARRPAFAGIDGLGSFRASSMSRPIWHEALFALHFALLPRAQAPRE